MDKQARLKQLNRYQEGTVLTEYEIVAEYHQLYRPKPTPITHPELFDPLNPPPGWEYDAWHAFWWQQPDPVQAKMELYQVGIVTVLTVLITLVCVLSS